MRDTVVLIFVNQHDNKIIHFCLHDVLSGSNNNIWFPISDEKNLFHEIEKIMINCRVAVNVTHINKLREGSNSKGIFADYSVTYNKLLD